LCTGGKKYLNILSQNTFSFFQSVLVCRPFLSEALVASFAAKIPGLVYAAGLDGYWV